MRTGNEHKSTLPARLATARGCAVQWLLAAEARREAGPGRPPHRVGRRRHHQSRGAHALRALPPIAAGGLMTTWKRKKFGAPAKRDRRPGERIGLGVRDCPTMNAD